MPDHTTSNSVCQSASVTRVMHATQSSNALSNASQRHALPVPGPNNPLGCCDRQCGAFRTGPKRVTSPATHAQHHNSNSVAATILTS